MAEGHIQLGDRLWAVRDLVAAVIGSIVTSAERAAALHESFDELILTHPESWGEVRLKLLRDAAEIAGIRGDRIRLVSEPAAAAAYYTRRHSPAAIAQMCVFDFGGGTCDVAIMHQTSEGDYRVIAARGDSTLGGDDFDDRLRGWVFEHLSTNDHVAMTELSRAASALTLIDQIRTAKETLSSANRAVIAIPHCTQALQITRSEFEGLVDDLAERAVRLAQDAITDSGGGRLPIFLSGGSSSIPLIHVRLSEVGDVRQLGDPKTLVVHGALWHASAAEHPAISTPAPGAEERLVPVRNRESAGPPSSAEVSEPADETQQIDTAAKAGPASWLARVQRADAALPGWASGAVSCALLLPLLAVWPLARHFGVQYIDDEFVWVGRVGSTVLDWVLISVATIYFSAVVAVRARTTRLMWWSALTGFVGTLGFFLNQLPMAQTGRWFFEGGTDATTGWTRLNHDLLPWFTLLMVLAWGLSRRQSKAWLGGLVVAAVFVLFVPIGSTRTYWDYERAFNSYEADNSDLFNTFVELFPQVIGPDHAPITPDTPSLIYVYLGIVLCWLADRIGTLISAQPAVGQDVTAISGTNATPRPSTLDDRRELND
ncbi:hypothetical protein C5O27_02680 [Gordonia alkanivorans]|nr:hypothetical protein C5O27_02680 [Gordonia alkanivorans]